MLETWYRLPKYSVEPEHAVPVEVIGIRDDDKFYGRIRLNNGAQNGWDWVSIKGYHDYDYFPSMDKLIYAIAEKLEHRAAVSMRHHEYKLASSKKAILECKRDLPNLKKECAAHLKRAEKLRQSVSSRLI